jgi:chromosome segregation protein
MHLKSITLKGFKSFPDRTTLEFGSGISVIVGPNGSGKSNITDAVLWALGEQSALAVRGQTMQDVIFAGSEGVRSRNAAEVEVVIDNSGGRLRSEFSELSISRRLDRTGEGGYRLNGARCRLVDVIEVLSDTGLGKEMHSVISQGRVEAIVNSKPIDRTALIEEAAGLSKHRKRRRRAQLKLERTQENLDRALDVEREARSHLRPLKRQAEAVELHARLERQSLELQGRLMEDELRAARVQLAEAEEAVATARGRRDGLEAEQSDVAHRREETERRLADHGRERERLSSRLFTFRSSDERMQLRLESVQGIARTLESRLERARRALAAAEEPSREGAGKRVAALEEELERLDRGRDARLASELEEIERERRQAQEQVAALDAEIEAAAAELEQANGAAAEARERTRVARERAEGAAREHAALEVELSAIAERLRLVARAEGPSLSDGIEVDEGFENALAGALGGRLGASVVETLREGTEAVERPEGEGERALVKGRRGPGRLPPPPTRNAERLLDHVRSEPEVLDLVELLLADAWVVERLADVPDGFEGIAVTRSGTSYQGAFREVRRLPAGGAERAVAERGRHAEVEAKLAQLASEQERAGQDADRAASAIRECDERLEEIETGLRELRRRREEAREQVRRTEWLIGQRREAEGGPEDARRAVVIAEITAERRLAERFARERTEWAQRRERLEAGIARDEDLLPAARGLADALGGALAATAAQRTGLEEDLAAGEAVGEQAAAELRTLARSEYELQAQLREAGELLTREEVQLAQTRDREAAVSSRLAEIARRLGYELAAAESPLAEAEREEIEAKLERLERRRERIGPINPLAEGEYQEALEHVEDLERQRKDLEGALAELERLIRETDRRIRESFERTFEASARNFEDMIQHFFPGGRGKLRLVQPQRPRPVLGGADPGGAEASEAGVALGAPKATGAAEGDPGTEDGSPPDPDLADDDLEGPRDETPGVEIEVTPAGKSTKRLSLLSGGEKSLVALAFLFAVFLARPCPFYILDEVEAALDDVNIDRFLGLVRRYSERSQFIVITHQRRTMEAADVLYGVSMGSDGVSKVVSRRLPRDEPEPATIKERLTEAA